eukprot:576219-Amphidinium_carterae.1
MGSGTWTQAETLIGTRKDHPLCRVPLLFLLPHSFDASMSSPMPVATVTSQVQQGMKQSELLLSEQVKAKVEPKMCAVEEIQSRVDQMDAKIQQSEHVESRQNATQMEMNKPGVALNEFAAQSRNQLKSRKRGADGHTVTHKSFGARFSMCVR